MNGSSKTPRSRGVRPYRMRHRSCGATDGTTGGAPIGDGAEPKPKIPALPKLLNKWQDLQPELMYLARSILRNKYPAEDLLMEVALKLLSVGPDDPSRFHPWVHLVVKRAALDKLRRLQRHPTLSLDHGNAASSGWPNGAMAVPAPGLSPSEVAMGNEQPQENKKRVSRFLESFQCSDEELEILRFRGAGHTICEIAEHLRLRRAVLDKGRPTAEEMELVVRAFLRRLGRYRNQKNGFDQNS